MKIAYVCYTTQEKYVTPGLEDEESILLQFLLQRGINLHKVIWNDPAVNWQEYDRVLLKSPWDYHENISAFYNWLDNIEAAGIPLINPYAIVKWNTDKHYLQDITAAGLPVIPSAIIKKGAQFNLHTYFEHFSTSQLIVKPCISAGAKNTFTVPLSEVADYTAILTPLVQEEAFLVQPYIPEIATEGEWSFIFLDGKFSHSVVKKPKAGDFRVQQYHGGTVHVEAPAAKHIESATAYVQQFAKDCLYARVDGVIIKEELSLMELELIEPFLFLGSHPEGYENYYKALKSYQHDTI
ncbi:ATP-grasp domain-containing protein [Chitinophaga niabensis]|uniref:Glutathione synthetase, ATP-grasp domain n=1 Tax=Chitinophaga niabensis TaxID=536979 RepID=A0A1N6D5D9_9BACT|nr:hypothetical protein [Chitinophaga niabensis]SIN65995.1 glutathione synthetase, ATP-grasp domain [Chitinophaga niabensis]